MYKIKKELCSVCGLCADICSVGAISQIGEYKINTEKCILCGGCKDSCPSNAIVESESPEIAVFTIFTQNKLTN